MSSKIRTIRRLIKRARTEHDYRQRYAVYRSTEEKPMSYRQWLAELTEQKKEA